MIPMGRRRRISTLAVALAAVLLSGCSAEPSVGLAPSRETTASQPEEDYAQLEASLSQEGALSSADTQQETLERTVLRDGVAWKYNSRLRTVLFMGVDTRESGEEKIGVGSNGRSDTLLLFVIDPDSETIRLITISRDTITKVDVYDRDRNYLFSGNMQLTMQYSFGDSPARSCQLVKKKVSSAILFDLPIHYHCSLTLDGILAASELVGGVTVTLEEDWTDIDPAYTAGSTVTLRGEKLERFLRYRDTDASGSNDVRMKRHGWFIRQLFAQMGRLGSAGMELLLEKLDPYLETDLDGDTIKQLASYTLLDEILNIPGETVQGKAHDEYHIDREACKEMLLDVYYRPEES